MMRAMTIEQAVEEVMRIHKSLPARPGIEEVEAARMLIQNVDSENQLQIEELTNQNKGKDVPEELFSILQEMKRRTIDLQSIKQKEEAQKLLDLEDVHQLFDDLILRVSECLKSNSTNSKSKNTSSSSNNLNSTAAKTVKPPSLKASSKDDSYLKTKTTFDFNFKVRSGDVSSVPRIADSNLKPALAHDLNGEKLSLIKLASFIEVSAKKGARELLLQGKLSDQIQWLPDSIGKLSSLIKLDLSENVIVVLPDCIGGLSSLQTLDLHGNKIQELPESIGELLALLHLDLRGNQLTSLPITITKLVHLQDLDLSSNNIEVLPETIGSLTNLKKLNIETNNIEEIPHAIGRCTSLKELHADYNRLKALPEAVGRIGPLEILTARYNNIRQLPTTMASLTSLKQLNLSFNELEAIPESLCFATTLVKMDVSNNFADLQSLPRSIGNLEMLEELMSHNNQIRALPNSFGMLTRLRVLNVEGNPLMVPPRDVIEKGAQAVVNYMADLVAKKETKSQPRKQKKSWAQTFQDLINASAICSWNMQKPNLEFGNSARINSECLDKGNIGKK